MNLEKKANGLKRKATTIINFMNKQKTKIVCDGCLSYRYMDAEFIEEDDVFTIKVSLDGSETQSLRFLVEDYLEEYKFFIDRKHKLIEIIRKPTWMPVEEFKK